jgi:hypothetical protein|tara:strand:- start:39 stop:704 length:666 start_codon:yes stop_codon:yes gene_type:complete
MGHLINEISRIKGIMGIISEGESQFDSSEKKIIDDFVDFVKKELKIDNDVEVKLQNDKDGIKTTAVYKYKDGEDEKFEDSEIRVYTLGRALVDVLRSIAHELVHHMQNEKGELEGKVSNVGGPIEDEANSVAGEMIKKYGLKDPEIYGDKEEVGEQESGEPDSSSTNSNVSTWETGISRGPANTLTVAVWNSGVSRGKGNHIDSTGTWETGISRGKSNPLN